MKTVSCKWFESKFDDFIASNLSDADDALAQTHLQMCADCRDNVDLWNGLGIALTKGKVSVKESLLEDVADKIDSGDWEKKKKSNRVLIGLVAGWLIIGLGGIGLGVLSYYRDRPDDSPLRSVATPPPIKNKVEKEQNAATALSIELDEHGRRFISPIKGTVLWLSEDAVISKAIKQQNHVWFELKKGTVLAEIGDVPDGFKFQVKTSTKIVEAHGTVFTVAIDVDSNTIVGVAEGKVKISQRNEPLAHNLVLPVGFKYLGGDDRIQPLSKRDLNRCLSSVFHTAPPPVLADRIEDSMKKMLDAKADAITPRHSASVQKSAVSNLVDDTSSRVGRLLKAAQAFRRERQFRDAARVYNEILRDFPDTNGADVASLSLVQLKLGPLNDPRGALADVTAFLNQPASPQLTLQGNVLKLNAHGALNQWNDVIQEADVLLNSVSNRHEKIQLLRLKSEAFIATGDCESASDVYRQILDSDVKAIDAQYANRGLKKCNRASE